MDGNSLKRSRGPEDYSHIKIQTLSLKGDYVTIINTGTDAVELSHWKLRSEVGVNQEFTFPYKTILQPGASTTVWSGKEADKKHNPPQSFFWTKRNIWYDIRLLH